MSEYDIGHVLVTDEESGEIVGILSDRDIGMRLVARDLDPHTPVGEICSHDVTTLRAGHDVTDAVDALRTHAVRRLPVVDSDNKPVGIISIEDLAASETVQPDDIREVLKAIRERRRTDRLGI